MVTMYISIIFNIQGFYGNRRSQMLYRFQSALTYYSLKNQYQGPKSNRRYFAFQMTYYLETP